MSDQEREGLNIKCHASGCDRDAAVRLKGVPLCAPHYNERLDQNLHAEPVNTRAGQLEPGRNRHP